MENVQSNPIHWTILVSAISALVALGSGIIFSIYNLNLSLNMYREQRPYFTLLNPHVEKMDADKFNAVIIVSVENIGHRPANNLRGKLHAFTMPFDEGYKFTMDFGSINDIAPGNQPSYNLKCFMPQKMPAMGFILQLEYNDVVSNKKSEQQFYMCWPGLKDGTGQQGFNHANIEDAEKLKKALLEQTCAKTAG